ncbi:UDP-N-acetylmuramoyl-L-alanine--D-glutamate ligase [Ferrovibrio terrae]|uniref:UDP-N-acetylmuramoylalanine--D-glutamate ligase n=1 Tax=Ferrovibrio terrae TaxID=2594003 RepID=A0A516H331_9PROT|nr:UDP-N-acetylmuramoyl-L-alanine--D-glutamate ligase [Ferrovibrio terrae]QDO98183.1 UDP-N-acetylmuramoyl-L-alanine--D-glutamate ligase [Ferrovibrio terrae]
MIALTHTRGQTWAVFGLARSGLATARALLAGGAEVRLWDDTESSRAAAAVAGFQPMQLHEGALVGCAGLALAPGVPLTHPVPNQVVANAQRAGVPIVGDIELLLRELKPAVYGITGTNGKSTTTALLSHVLRGAGRLIAMGGNIGQAVLELPRFESAKDGTYVIEMSSFQIDLTPSWQARIALLLNITPDHLDRHGSMDNYAAIKARIFAGQSAGDTAVIGVDDDYCRAIHAALVKDNTGRTITPISIREILPRGVSALDGQLYENGKAVFALDFPALPGSHNGQNIAAAFAAARAAGLDAETIRAGITSFPGLKHRLQRVGSIDGISCINDSKATNADSAEKALAAFENVYWIAGGKAKDGGIASLKALFPRVRRASLIGEAAGDFAATLGNVPHALCGTLDKALDDALAAARKDRIKDAVVLLSPACASYDQFKSFEHRGDEFIRLVQERGASEQGAAA